ncbi:MAG: GTP-binding protein [Promethearchaeota archaeon]
MKVKFRSFFKKLDVHGAYSMKISVCGPLKSGKSSFIKYFDKKALNVEAKARNNQFYTVGMDIGIVKLNGFDVFLFGTPGLLRFNVMRDIIVQGTDGVIFIFDSVHPEKDEDAIIILNSIKRVIGPEVPIVYLANKQDLENARPPEVVKAQNYLPKNAVIFSTSIKTGLNVEKALKFIVNQIYENYSSLLNILRLYENDIPGLAKELNKDISELRVFLNNLELKRFIELNRSANTYKVKNGLNLLI